jgi:regulator of nucleoside diphosphate kinase
MTGQITITINDYNRLIGLLELASLKTLLPDMAGRLYANLLNAKTLPQEKIDERIITMNSRVYLRDVNNQRKTEVTLTYPHEAEPRERKVSVLSEIGIALLGRHENDLVSWKVPGGIGLFEIVKVTYQPEAAGDYYL